MSPQMGQHARLASAAVTMLLLVMTACIPPLLLGALGWLAHAPALPLTAAAAGLFARRRRNETATERSKQ
jgi:hypothetical protein